MNICFKGKIDNRGPNFDDLDLDIYVLHKHVTRTITRVQLLISNSLFTDIGHRRLCNICKYERKKIERSYEFITKSTCYGLRVSFKS